MPKEETLAELEAELAAANAHLGEARSRLSMVRSVECDALNRVNDVQKKITARLERLQVGAPGGSDWKRITTREAA